ncbi:MAG: M15 family metallopeptidase [Oscillospiraceae bacterium]
MPNYNNNNPPQRNSGRATNNTQNRQQAAQNRNYNTGAGYNPGLNQQQIYLKKLAKEKRRRMLLRRRRIAFCVLTVFICLLIFFILKLVLKKTKPVVAPPTSVSASASVPSSSIGANSQAASAISDAASSAPSESVAANNDELKVDLTSWEMLLANANNPLPDGYLPELELVDTQQHKFDKRAAASLKKMLADGNATGLNLMICSAYRSHERQTTLFNQMLEQNKKSGMTDDEAYAATKKVRNVPGTSEHETGLAADIVSTKHQNLDDSFETTPEFAWLIENCADYGFILRYPREKSAITGTIYEPWHYRYVGIPAAKAIKKQGVCLEEFIELTK